MAGKDNKLKKPAGTEAPKKEIARLRAAERSLRKQVEELERFKRRLEYIVGVTRTGVDIIDSDFNIIYIDPAWQKVYGDPAGKKCFEYFMDRAQVCDGCGIPEALRTGRTIVTEEVLVREDNRVVEVHTFPFTDTDGKVYVAEFNFDITKRRKLEEKAREAKVIIENSPVILFRWRNDAGWPVEYVSENVAQWGYEADEFIRGGRPYTEIIHPDDLDRVIEEVGEYIGARKTEYDQEYRIVTRGGEIRRVFDRTRVILDEQGSVGSFQGVLTDITETKAAEEALRRSEVRSGTLIQNIHDIITVLDAGGTIVYMSPSVESHLGYRPDEMVGRFALDQVHPDDREIVTRDLDEVFRRGNPGTPTEFRYARSDGSYAWFETIATNLLDDPAINGILVISRNVTERKRVEDELRKNQHFSQRITETVPMTIYIYDIIDDRNIYSNKNIFGLIGYTPEEISAMGHDMFRTLLHPDDFAMLGDNLRRFDGVSDTDVLELEYRMKDSSGEWRWLHSWDVVFARTPEGKPAQILGAVQDISTLKRAQEALLESEAKYRSLSEASQDLIFVIGRDDTVRYVNTGASRLLGRDRGDIIGKKRTDLFPAGLAGRQGMALAKVFESGEAVRSEGVMYRGGEELWMDHCLVPLKNDRGEIDSVLGISRDITERKRSEDERIRMEAQLRQTQKLESLGVLAGGIAHDFNNLLTGILGNADLAMTALPAGAPALMYIEEIQKITGRAAELCGQMLAYSGKGMFEVRPLDLNDLLSDMTHLIEVSVSRKAVLTFNLAEGLPAIHADQTQIRQVVMNLLINASESIVESSGMITISTGVRECDRSYLAEALFGEGLAEGRYVFLEVADTGVGMTGDTIARIFEPFFTTKFAGRGLGLAAVLGIVRGHRGMMSISSVPGKGTRFTVLFPAVDMEAESIRRGGMSFEGWRGSGTVLLVDDVESVLLVGSRMLEQIGFRVLAADSGAEAVRILSRNPAGIRCVILDLTMPMMSGEETFAALREVDPDVKIIISSGYNESEVSEKFRGKNISGFIKKPYRLSDLVSTLRSL